MENPWLTVATVVRNDPDGFLRTARSLDEQTFKDFEFVVIDSSDDETVINDAIGEFPQLANCVNYHWQVPQGIYPAMNSALNQARGRYAYFLNAGDCLEAYDVLERVSTALSVTNPVWAFGPIEIEERNGAVVRTRTWDYSNEKKHYFARGLFPSHQGTFALTDVLRSFGGFDTQYSIAADYAMALHLSELAPPVLLNFVIARFSEGGVSTNNWVRSFLEFHHARQAILQLDGLKGLHERFHTLLHLARVGAYRGIIERWRA